MKITNENLAVQLQLHNEKAMDFLVNEYSIYLSIHYKKTPFYTSTFTDRVYGGNITDHMEAYRCL